MNTEKKDIFQRVTDQIVEAIEEGAGSYRMPWRTSGGFPNSPINAVSKKPYRGVNMLVLWATAEERGYSPACGRPTSSGRSSGPKSERARNRQTSFSGSSLISAKSGGERRRK